MSDDNRQSQQAVILSAEGHLALLLSRLFIMQRSVCASDDSETGRWRRVTQQRAADLGSVNVGVVLFSADNVDL